MQSTPYHIIGEITCNDPKVSTLNDDITVYSENAYKRYYYNNMVYILFKEFKEGYIYIDVAEASRSCAFVNFTNIAKDMDQKAIIKDFIMKDSDAMFTIAEVPKN